METVGKPIWFLGFENKKGHNSDSDFYPFGSWAVKVGKPREKQANIRRIRYKT